MKRVTIRATLSFRVEQSTAFTQGHQLSHITLWHQGTALSHRWSMQSGLGLEPG